MTQAYFETLDRRIAVAGSTTASPAMAKDGNTRAAGGPERARLARPPLDVLLGFSGLKRASVTLPDGRGLSLAEEMHA